MLSVYSLISIVYYMQSHTTVDDVREDISELKKEISKNKQVGIRFPVRSSESIPPSKPS